MVVSNSHRVISKDRTITMVLNNKTMLVLANREDKSLMTTANQKKLSKEDKV